MTSPKLILSALLISLIACCGCGDGYGEKIVVDGTEVYFDGEKVTKSEAETLGRYLKETSFTDGTEKAVQLEKDGEKHIFKMVMQPEFLESGTLDREFKLMCLQLSSAFQGVEFECHACNDELESQGSVTGLSGKLVRYEKSELYHNHLTDEQLTHVRKVLDQFGFKEFEGTLFFGKAENGFEFRMICTEEFQQDEEAQRESKIWQEEFSKAVGGEKVAVMLCNEYFEPQYTRAAE